MKLLVPTDCPEIGEAPRGVQVVTVEADERVPHAHRDFEALVVWGQPVEALARAARSLSQLRWVQS